MKCGYKRASFPDADLTSLLPPAFSRSLLLLHDLTFGKDLLERLQGYNATGTGEQTTTMEIFPVFPQQLCIAAANDCFIGRSFCSRCFPPNNNNIQEDSVDKRDIMQTAGECAIKRVDTRHWVKSFAELRILQNSNSTRDA